MQRVAAVVLIAALSGACSARRATDTPETAWTAFRKAVERHDVGTAMTLLSAADRAALEARAEDAAAAREGGDPIEADDMLVLAGHRLPEWRSVSTRVDGDQATLVITLDGDRTEEVRAVRERGGWRVVLGIGPP